MWISVFVCEFFFFFGKMNFDSGRGKSVTEDGEFTEKDPSGRYGRVRFSSLPNIVIIIIIINVIIKNCAC